MKRIRHGGECCDTWIETWCCVMTCLMNGTDYEFQILKIVAYVDLLFFTPTIYVEQSPKKAVSIVTSGDISHGYGYWNWSSGHSSVG
jgi:hypothetical protein